MVPIIYIVIPCFNEEKVLPITSKLFLEKLQRLQMQGTISPKSQIMFVNDGSSDGTWEFIRKIAKENHNYSGISLSRNMGHQAALLAGLMEAKDKKGRYVPDACDKIRVSVRGHGEILGWGNGDPGYKTAERLLSADKRETTLNAFMGNAQVIIRSLDSKNKAVMPTVVFLQLNDGEQVSVTLSNN